MTKRTRTPSFEIKSNKKIRLRKDLAVQELEAYNTSEHPRKPPNSRVEMAIVTVSYRELAILIQKQNQKGVTPRTTSA